MKNQYTTIISPKAKVVLDHLNIKYNPRVSRSGFIIAQCPFHANGNEKNYSLSINEDIGYFRCFSCNAKGGNTFTFYRRVTGATFHETLIYWGA